MIELISELISLGLLTLLWTINSCRLVFQVNFKGKIRLVTSDEINFIWKLEEDGYFHLAKAEQCPQNQYLPWHWVDFLQIFEPTIGKLCKK